MRHVHFIVSATPRGGFSGGLTVIEYDFALGVITTSLVMNHKEPESGFFTVLTIEPILNCLAEHKLLPDCQAEGWDDMWNSDSKHYCRRHAVKSRLGDTIVGALGIFDNGKRFYLEFHLDDNDELFAKIREQSHQVLQPIMTSEELVREHCIKLARQGHNKGVQRYTRCGKGDGTQSPRRCWVPDISIEHLRGYLLRRRSCTAFSG